MRKMMMTPLMALILLGPAAHLRAVPPLWLRPAVALDALGFYALKIALPFHLAPDYGRTAERLWSSGTLAWSWMPAAAVLASAWWMRARWPAVAAAVGLFLGAVLPVLGFVPFDFQYYSNVADHYVYLAMLGPAVGVAFACRQLSTRTRAIVVATGITALFVLSLGQTAHWKDDVTVAARTLAANPSWREVDLNPVIAGKQAVAVDALIIADPEDPDWDYEDPGGGRADA